MLIKDAQHQVDRWIQNIGGGYFSELTNLGILVEETGELARWLVRKYGDQNMKPDEQTVDIKEVIEDEMADILWVLMCLANQMDVDLTEALEKNIIKKTRRDHDRHKRPTTD